MKIGIELSEPELRALQHWHSVAADFDSVLQASGVDLTRVLDRLAAESVRAKRSWLTTRPPDVSVRFGAPMGRAPSEPLADNIDACWLFQVRLDSGGYDAGGAYWGVGQKLWVCLDNDRVPIKFLRAPKRSTAVALLKGIFPSIGFRRER